MTAVVSVASGSRYVMCFYDNLVTEEYLITNIPLKAQINASGQKSSNLKDNLVIENSQSKETKFFL